MMDNIEYKNTADTNIRSIIRDLNSPLDEVERKWIRRPAVVALTPFLMIYGALRGIITFTAKTYRDCW